MYPVILIRGTHILLPKLIMQTVSFIYGAFHLKLLCNNVVYFSTHAFSSKFYKVSSIIIFNGRRSNHQKLLKISLGVLMWSAIHRCNNGTQHLKYHCRWWFLNRQRHYKHLTKINAKNNPTIAVDFWIGNDTIFIAAMAIHRCNNGTQHLK